MENYIYELKSSLLTDTEKKFYYGIKEILPNEYILQPQVNLASIIDKINNTKFANELFRNVDFCIFDKNYKPIFIIEVNDDTHLQKNRQARDYKVKNICEEAGIPILTLWTKYGVNQDYISKKIIETLEKAKNPIRIKHSKDKDEKADEQIKTTNESTTNDGCYIATAVYGNYDCPNVWILRRYRDYKLKKSAFGRTFIKAYYFISPKLVALLGKSKQFIKLNKLLLDKKVYKLKKLGYSDKPYNDL